MKLARRILVMALVSALLGAGYYFTAERMKWWPYVAKIKKEAGLE